MHWIAPAEKDTNTAALEKRLWDAADQFRANSGRKSQEYSAPVLGLIFLRFAEVRFAAQRAKLEKAAASSRRGPRVDEPAAYHAEGILYLPAEARFDYLLSRPEAENIGAKVNEVPCPPLPVQRRIAGILSAYDELMENSQRRIRLLEAMGRALYREWFVHFRFPDFAKASSGRPGHEKLPRVASPLGDIPQGWGVKPLSALCSRMESGGTPKRKSPEYWLDGSIDWFKTGELWDGFLFGSEEKITELGQRESNARSFEPGTILMAIYGSPTVGRLGILTRPSSCNQAALGLVADKKQISQTFLYFVLLSLRDHFNGLAQGAAQQNISKAKVANAVALVPPRALVAAFDRLAEPTFSQIQTLQRQVQNLDLLLPRLLSGQVSLSTN